MAVRITPARGMNGLSQKNFEAATKYEVKETAFGLTLNIYEGNKKVSTYAPGCWESVDLYTPLDERRKAAKKSPKKAGAGSRVTREGARIRTSPLRGDKL